MFHDFRLFADRLLRDTSSGVSLDTGEIRARREAIVRRARIASELGAYVEEINELKKAANTDPLTELPNRRGLTQYFEDRRATGNSDLIGVGVLDLDHFKKINDTFGHDAGDAVLRHVASLLQKHVVKIIQSNTRSYDRIVVRAGGEEIYLFMPASNMEQFQAKLEELRQAIEKNPCKFRGREIPITGSFGGAIYDPTSGEDYKQAIERADQATYASKMGGRNRVSRAEPYADRRGIASGRLRRHFGRRPSPV